MTKYLSDKEPFKIEAVTRMVFATPQFVAHAEIETDPSTMRVGAPGKRKVPMSLPRVRFLERPEVVIKKAR